MTLHKTWKNLEYLFLSLKDTVKYFLSSCLLVVYNAHSIEAVIDYVTVYRAHSSSDKEEGCDIPFRAVPLYAPLRADNSVTGGCPPLRFADFKISLSCLQVAGTKLALTFLRWPECLGILRDLLCQMQFRRRSYDSYACVATVVVARTSTNNICNRRSLDYIEFSRTFERSDTRICF